MTIEKAIEIVNKNGWGYPENENIEAHLMAQEAMKRAMPAKPTESRKPANGGLFVEAKCPKCGRFVYEPENFCSNCGQALDWEVEK